MRIGIYGGSFNPPHVVHAMVASWMLWTDMVDEVWLVPVYKHAFTGIHDKMLAAYEERVKWCELLGAEISTKIKVSKIESTLPTPSYTVDTLQALSEKFPTYQFRLCIGADVIPDLPKWKDWNIIEANYSPIIVGRVGYETIGDLVEFPGVSSSQIRKQLAVGKIPTELLSSSVVERLRKYNPYGGA